MFRIDDNEVIDATMCGGPARYVNHSCNPNCMAEVVSIGEENKIIIIAKRRISRGEEVGVVDHFPHFFLCFFGAAAWGSLTLSGIECQKRVRFKLGALLAEIFFISI